MTKEEQLRKTEFGSINAEDDNGLIEYFVETPVFDEILEGKLDLIIGPKGAGKSAIFKIIAEKQGFLKGIEDKLIIPINTPNSMLELESIKERVNDEQRTYRLLWKVFVALFIAKSIIESPISSEVDTSEMKKILSSGGFEVEVTKKLPISSWIKKLLSAPYFSVIFEDIEYKLGLDLLRAEEQDKTKFNVSSLLKVENSLLEGVNKEAWILLDRLDEILPGIGADSEPQEKALQGLMNAYSDLRLFKNIRLKIFLRKDIYDNLQFVNKDHFSDKKVNISWDGPHLKRIIAKRIFSSLNNRAKKFEDKKKFTDQLAEKYFDIVFDKIIVYNRMKKNTFDWMMENLQDGNGFVSPRDLLNLVAKAHRAQLDFYSRDVETPKEALIGEAAVIVGFKDASVDKLQDYLYGVFRYVKEYVEKFRGSLKRRFSKKEIEKVVESKDITDLYLILKRLCEIGFLKKIGLKSIEKTDNFEIPVIYAQGLDIKEF